MLLELARIMKEHPPSVGIDLVLLDGEDVTKWRPSKRVRQGGLAYVPQGQLSFGQMTTMENLQVVADGRRGGKRKIDELLDQKV